MSEAFEWTLEAALNNALRFWHDDTAYVAIPLHTYRNDDGEVTGSHDLDARQYDVLADRLRLDTEAAATAILDNRDRRQYGDGDKLAYLYIDPETKTLVEVRDPEGERLPAGLEKQTITAATEDTDD